MAEKQYDRSTQDLGNIVNLGHVNVCISDQHLATYYYITGLGLTREIGRASCRERVSFLV